MIKEILATSLLAIAINNTQVNNFGRDTGTFTPVVNTYQNITYDNNGDLQTATYYQIKELQNTLYLEYATAKIKGYTYLYVNKTNETYKCYTDFYVILEYNDPDLYNFTFDSLIINLRGYINPNSTLDLYYEDYYLYGQNLPNGQITNFIYATSYTLQELETVRQTNLTQITATANYVDTVGTNTTITLPNRYQVIKWRIDWKSDLFKENEEINTNLIPNFINSLTSVYTNTTTQYYWTFEVEYTQEVIDLPGLLFTMLGMPFAWISTAFNLTLFPGTMYELHVASLFMALIGVLIFVFILRRLLK